MLRNHPAMSLQELVELCILQKDYHALSSNATTTFENKFRDFMKTYQITAQHVLAPAMYPDQPHIPFVLFKPVIAKGEKRPVIIHVHGGPHVYMSKDKPHAEIMFFLSKGYVVVCPNYRGSNNYPYEFGWGENSNKFMKHSSDKINLHVYAPQDVYTVATLMQKMAYVDSGKMTLRGGSFGSFVNAHLLAAIQQGIYKNIFNGVHLSGGVKYPDADAMPTDIPIFISHAVNDKIAPFERARHFMEKLLLRQLTHEIQGERLGHVQTFISQHGDHHLISPALTTADIGKEEYHELASYLAMSTQFIDAVNGSDTLNQTETYDQYKTVMGPRLCKIDDVAVEVVRRVQARNYVKSISVEMPYEPVTAQAIISADEALCPTMAHMKLQLGDNFSGDIETDLREFLLYHFKPVLWEDKKKQIFDAGVQILADEAFFKQMVEMIEKERDFMRQHPDYVVIYHAGEDNVLQLYTFINIWRNLLTDLPPAAITALKEMRMFDFMKDSVEDIDTFLEKMRRRRYQATIFNYIPGFNDRALSGNPALTFNSHNTAASSLWWYFSKRGNTKVKMDDVIEMLFKLIGIHAPERVAKYRHLFKRWREEINATKISQAVMQQSFWPTKLAGKYAYLCQLWGEELGENNFRLHDPASIEEFCKDPDAFEKKLRLQKEIFTNPGECPEFGRTDKGFNYTASLQLRYLFRSDPSIIHFTYVRNLAMHRAFIKKLAAFSLADYADYLASTYHVHPAVVAGADECKAKHLGKLGFFNVADTNSIEEVYYQQHQLYQGLEQDTAQDWYRGVLVLDKESKTQLQQRLLTVPRRTVHLFALCVYLKGYTYYDLLMEAAHYAYVANPDIDPKYRHYYQEDYENIKAMIEKFSSASSIDTEHLSSNGYHSFKTSLDNLRCHRFDPAKHQAFADKDAADHCYSDEDVFGMELGSAMECVNRHALMCKEQNNNHDMSRRKKSYW